jgi:hypothetical protein
VAECGQHKQPKRRGGNQAANDHCGQWTLHFRASTSGTSLWTLTFSPFGVANAISQPGWLNSKATQQVSRISAVFVKVSSYGRCPGQPKPSRLHRIYYHPDHDTHAPVPSNIELCRRVLTIMRADEY